MRFIRIYSFSLTLILAVNAHKLYGHDFEDIVKSVDTHRRMYNTNKLATGRMRQYAIDIAGGKPVSTLYDDSEFEFVQDAAGNRRYTTTASLLPERVGQGSYVTPDIHFTIFKTDGRYYIRDFSVKHDNLLRFIGRSQNGAAWMPSSFDWTRSIEYVAVAARDASRVTHTFSISPPSRVQKYGKGVVAVESVLRPKAEFAGRKEVPGIVRQTSYFDPDNSFVYLGSESSIPPTQQYPWPHRISCTLDYYQPVKGRLPIPKRYTRCILPDNGDRLLEVEIDYIRFEDYVPDAEDFRLEKRYGLTTPVGPDDRKLIGVRSSSRSSRVGFWVSVLVGTVVIGLLAIWLYRLRKSTETTTTAASQPSRPADGPRP